MKEPIKKAYERYSHVHAIDRIAVPLIAAMGVEMAYRKACEQLPVADTLPGRKVATITGPLFAGLD